MIVFLKIDNRNQDSVGNSLREFKSLRSTKDGECMIIGRTQDDGSVLCPWRGMKFCFTDIQKSEVLAYGRRR
jgi:hypothetical protein